MPAPADITFIIPAYNCEDYLPELKRSLEHQSSLSYRTICVDDGSTDGTGALLDSWAARDSRYHVIHQTNGGLSHARNAGISYLLRHKDLQTRYLMFIDADDAVASDSIPDVVSMATALKLDVLYFTAAPFYENAELKEKHANYDTYYQRSNTYEGVYCGLDYLAETVKNGEFLPSAALQIIRMRFLIDNELSFEEGIIHEDNLFTARCLIAASRVAYLDRPLYLRRVREGSIMTTKVSSRNVQGYFKAGAEILKWSIGHSSNLSDQQKAGIEQFVFDMFGGAYNCALQIPNPEIQFDSLFEQTLYSCSVLERVRQNRQNSKSLSDQQRICENQVDAAKRDTEHWIKSSTTWRVGNFLMMAPRKIKSSLKRVLVNANR